MIGLDKEVELSSHQEIDKCSKMPQLAQYIMFRKLDFQDALHLFSLKGFKKNGPTKIQVELSKCVVGYCEGNLLALVVLGCFLYGRRKEERGSALVKLKQGPQMDIFNVLGDKQKIIFLDLACFFRETNKLSMEVIKDYYLCSARYLN